MKVKLGIMTWCYLLLMLINYNKDSYYVSAKSLDITQQSCHEHVGEFFKSFLNISIVPSQKLGECFFFFKIKYNLPPSTK
jgi:hypothetical protein